VRNENGSSVLYAATDILFYGGQWNGSPTQIGLMRSTNGGTSFTNVMPALSGSVYTYAVADIEIDANNRIWCGTRRNYALSGSDLGGGRIFYSDDGQNYTLAYTRTTALQGRVELACAPSNKDTFYAVFEANNQCEAVMRSFDRGANWTSFTEPDDADLGISSTDFTREQAWYDLILSVNPKKASEVLIGGIDLFRSTEAGNNWAQISRWSIRNANLNQLSCSYVHADQHQIAFHPDGKRVLFGNHGGVFYAHNQNPDTLFITLSNYGITNIYYSLNGGSSWNAADGNLGNMPVHSIVSNPFRPGEVLIGTELGVYGCDNIFKAQPVWKALNENMGAVKVSGLYLRETDGMIMCTTHGRGVYTSDIWRPDYVFPFRFWQIKAEKDLQ
jgi:hypothetical protein